MGGEGHPGNLRTGVVSARISSKHVTCKATSLVTWLVHPFGLVIMYRLVLGKQHMLLAASLG